MRTLQGKRFLDPIMLTEDVQSRQNDRLEHFVEKSSLNRHEPKYCSQEKSFYFNNMDFGVQGWDYSSDCLNSHLTMLM